MLLLLLSGITVNAQLQNCSHLQRSNGFQRHSQPLHLPQGRSPLRQDGYGLGWT